MEVTENRLHQLGGQMKCGPKTNPCLNGLAGRHRENVSLNRKLEEMTPRYFPTIS